MSAKEVDPRKIKKNADSKFIEALSDVPVEGSNEAVYFVLRGLGMKAFEGPGDLPRIEIMAAQHPKLFAALRRLGLRHIRDRIILEPRGDDGPNLFDTTASRGKFASSGSKFSSSCPDLRPVLESGLHATTRTLRPPRLRGHGIETAEDRKVFYHQMSYPKGVARKFPFAMALHEAKGRQPPSLTAAREAAAASQPSSPKRGPEPNRLPDIRSSRTMNPSRSTQEAEGLVTTPTSAQSVDQAASAKLWDRLYRPRRSPQEQESYFTKLAKPKVVRPKVVPVEFGVREQSAFGRASERHLLARLRGIQEAKLIEELEREESARREARCCYDDAEDSMMSGTAPPDPSPVASDCEDE
ncbi:unnamed protein product [Symbiodinium natans]|uniref:Uncharacterized protein n=1 Tax=Symbiodinium natans TaxID=878477 RepID=A0A812U3X3_9DINO|nr:unnamed protein product [Symbiodinium natans]